MNESYTKTIENKRKLICKNDIISVLIFLSLLGIPTKIQATTQKTKYDIKNIIELNDTANLLDKMNQKFGINLPAQYNENLKNFISNSATLHNEAASQFTENFISEQMSQNRGISKENQYLFIWCTIYSTLTNGELYDGTDGNTQRYNEYEMAFDYFLNCEENYKTKLKELMENEQQRARDDAQRAREDVQRSREDVQRSRDDVQRSRDDVQRSRDDVMAGDTLLLNEMIRFYNLYENNSNILTTGEIQEIKRIAKETIESCNRHGIDYRTYFLKKLGDNKKVENLLKICEIE